MKKAEIRKQQLARRMALSDAELNALSEQLLERFSSLNFSQIRVVHIFLPIKEQNEPNTFLLIQWLRTYHPHIRIVIPRADFTTLLMTNYEYTGELGLLKSKFNILEPIEGEKYTGEIDMVMVPLVAFDSKGFRVGYGKGFYDRFLKTESAVSVGLSLFESVDTISDIHEYDIPLDLCITPAGITDFTAEANAAE